MTHPATHPVTHPVTHFVPHPGIHTAFAERVREQPGAVALVHAGGRLTYAELDELSSAIAGELAASGVGPGNVVPVVVPVSARLVATVLAVLKRGAAYAALDPSWPAERLRRIDSLLPGQVAVVEADVDAFPRRAGGAWRPPAITAPGAAMVFFTSGSTGEPKAVVSPHGATTRLFDGCTFATFDRTTVVAQVSAVPWDAFALELWGPLVTGGTCALVEDRPLMPSSLRALVAGAGVNTMFLTTSLFHLVVEEDVAAFAGLRTLMVGGEKLSARHAGRFLAAHPDVRLVNAYGPVESTVFALTHDVRPPDAAGEVPLGRPVPRTSVHVVAGDRECAPGEVGELVVAGDGLALGYLGDPVLTAAKFTTLRLGGRETRAYRTGDLGVVDGAGVFHFRGRGDRQVKVRGHRLEPAGVEHVANAVPGVRRAVVVPVTDDLGTCRALALFFTSDALDAPALRDELRRGLPAYSVPDHVVAVEAFPLSANGKVDTRALLALLPPESTPAGSSDDDVLAECAALIGSADPSRSFFDQGGTSLAAVRLCTRLGARHGRPVPVSRLMTSPTLADFRAWLSTSFAGVQVGQPHLTPMQHSFLVRHQVAGGADVENHCPLRWTITGPLDPDALAAAVQDVHRRHGYLHAAYTDDDLPLARPGDLPAAFALVTTGPDAAPAEPLRSALAEPLDLEAGAPWRAVLVRTPGAWHFGLTAHHIAFDGWSRHRIAEDLSVAYRARAASGEPRWEVAVPSPAETHRALTELASAADVEAQRAFWGAEVADLPTPVFPAGGAGEVVVEHPVDPAVVDAVARDRGVGRSAVLVEAVAEALAVAVGWDDFGVGVPVTRRGTEALELPVGCLIDMVCVRVGGRPAGEAVTRALAHADLPYAEVARLRRSRDPLYRVIAAVQDSPEPRLELPGCEVTWHDEPTAPLAELQVELIAPVGGAAKLRVTRDPGRVDAAVMAVVGERVLKALGG